jgi:hypothetical protein
MNVPALVMEAATGNTGFGPQAGPTANRSFTVVNFTSGLVGPSTTVHPSFITGTMVAYWGTPPLFNAAGGPLSASSASMTQEGAPTPAEIFSRVAIIDCRRGIRCATWSPATLGLSSSNN